MLSETINTEEDIGAEDVLSDRSHRCIVTNPPLTEHQADTHLLLGVKEDRGNRPQQPSAELMLLLTEQGAAPSSLGLSQQTGED